MRDVISNYTVEQINAVIDEILVNLNANVRNLSGTGADSERPVLFSYTNYNGQTFYVRGSKFLYNIVVDSADGYELKRDVTSVIGDKSGIKLAPALVDYRKEHAQYYWTGSCGIRNNDGTTNGYEFYMDAMHDGDTQYASIDIMSYKVIGVEAGSTHTVTFRGRFGTTSHGGGDVYACISDSATDTTGMGRVVLTKDNDWHDYTFTFTNTSSEDTLYLNFVFNVGYTTGTGRYLVEGLLFSGMDIDILSTHVYYNGEWYEVSGAGGGSSDVELIEISKADYDALPQSAKDDPNKAYFVYNYPSGSGGSGGASALVDLSDVDISNPSNGQVLKYNSTTQKWENGTSGGGRTLTSLWTNTGNTNPSSITLSDAYTNYDDFICMCYRSANNTYEPEFYQYISDRMPVGCNFACLAWSGSSDYITFTITDSTTFTRYNQGSHLVIKEVIGVKYG